MFKNIFIIFLILVAAVIAGGSYYYFEIYEPGRYASSVIPLYQKLETAGFEPDTSSLKSAADYESALKILSGRISLLESLRNDLGQIKMPKRMANFHEEFLGFIDFTFPRHKHAEKLGLFVKNARELKIALDDILHGAVSQEPGKIMTVGELQKFWDERIPGLKILGIAMFQEELAEIKDPSFSELKFLWDNGSPVLDLAHGKMKSFSPKLLVSQLGNPFTPSEAKQLETYTKNLEEFSKKLDVLLQKYSAYDLLTLRYYPEVFATEASERALKFYRVMEEFKGRYVK